ncbi:hypothetical protein LCGC14_2597830 [marine sediment metagenome]|uniref:NADH:ubiquinone reductase (Na(+)-transporting) subunit E n=1 Tax=marine sediment metagenome TaxID=412755 RepID=A0A0F9D2F4_9ZZZZ
MTVDQIPVWMIVLASIFTSNILLVNFLGMCSFLACSKRIPTALGLGVAVIFVMTCTAAINFGVHQLLVKWDLVFLEFIIFIAVIAAFVQFVEMFVERFSQPLYYALGIFLPLITVNCAILGASLFLVNRQYSLGQSVGFGFGGGVGWALAIIMMAGLQQKLKYSKVPRIFKGVAIIMIITGVMAMAFMGFAGMVTIQ